MSKLWILQQYPAKMRYNEWFGKEIAHQLRQRYVECVLIEPDCKVVKSNLGKDFQPQLESILYELESLKILHSNISKLDSVLVLDPSYPGYITNLRTWFDGPIYVYCHATSQNYLDIFEPIRDYKWQLEQAFLNECDVIFVGSQYHAQKLQQAGVKALIVNIGFPKPPIIDQYKKEVTNKNGRILIASRYTEQKISPVFNEVSSELPIDIQTFATWDDYYHALQIYSCVASFAQEETFGITTAEALYLGTPVLVPNKLAYKELYPEKYKYNNAEDFKQKFKNILFDTNTESLCIFNTYFYDELVRFIGS